MSYTMPRPNRHGDIISRLNSLGLRDVALAGEQGFMTSSGEFATRWQALRIAANAEQVKYELLKRGGIESELFTEDLW